MIGSSARQVILQSIVLLVSALLLTSTGMVASAQTAATSLEGTWRIRVESRQQRLIEFGVAVLQKTETAGFYIGLMNIYEPAGDWATEEIKVKESGDKVTIFATIVRTATTFAPDNFLLRVVDKDNLQGFLISAVGEDSTAAFSRYQ